MIEALLLFGPYQQAAEKVEALKIEALKAEKVEAIQIRDEKIEALNQTVDSRDRVGSGRCCSPRHRHDTSYESSFLEVNGIL